MPIRQAVRHNTLTVVLRWFDSSMGSFGGMMIEATLLVDMMAKYINENGIKELMKLVMQAIEATKE